jgi:RNA polymerase sigma-70 factor (ECF subfamily)
MRESASVWELGSKQAQLRGPGPGSALGGGEADVAASFDAFFESEFERLVKALFLVCGSLSEAEDLAQDAMVRVYERWDRVARMDSSSGYLYRTALNLHRSRLRQLRVRARRTVVAVGSSSDPAMDAIDRAEVDRMLASLPDGQRAALVLVEWVGMTDAEAAQVLGIKAGSVRARLSRARAAIRAGEDTRDD